MVRCSWEHMFAYVSNMLRVLRNLSKELSLSWAPSEMLLVCVVGYAQQMLDCWSACPGWPSSSTSYPHCDQANENINHLLVPCGNCGTAYSKVLCWKSFSQLEDLSFDSWWSSVEVLMDGQSRKGLNSHHPRVSDNMEASQSTCLWCCLS